ncbi:MAG: hypothetical protein PHP46_05305 [Candidatus Omnitrophica bacterium]|nr:hypothetical protein [Candidatus Omnitrophota bacterium]
MRNEKERSAPSGWETFRRSVPWRDITLSFLIPKTIFYIAMNKPWMLTGASIAIAWCAVLFAAKYLLSRKINFWALIALVMILIQMAPVIIKDDPNMNFVAGAFDSLLFGIIFLSSIIIKRPLIRVFAEATGARDHIPEPILKSPYYMKAWAIVTAAWAAVYIVESVILLYLALNRSRALLPFDIFCGWPTVLLMIFFSVQFPAVYWKAVAVKAGFAEKI